jgi:response regulator RpfG family c-di-GMP phosphodiesterase
MKTIVLIDDNQDDLQSIKESIKSEDSDIQPLSFVFGEEAVAGIVSGVIERPYAVLINLNLKGAPGLECLQKIRAIRHFDNVPMIVYAPRISDEVSTILNETGFVLSFNKPTTIRGWKVVVREMLTSIHAPGLDMEILIADSRNQLFYNS